MVVEKFEYYCDCCMKQVEKKEDLKNIKILLEDEQCKRNTSRLAASPIIPRLYVDFDKAFCPSCYEDYRNAISDFVSTMAQFGILEDKEEEEDDDDLM